MSLMALSLNGDGRLAFLFAWLFKKRTFSLTEHITRIVMMIINDFVDLIDIFQFWST